MREFRAHHEEFVQAGVTVAGVSLDAPEASRAEAARLALPYPLLSDEQRAAGTAFHVIRRVPIAGWTVELFSRVTVLIDAQGVISAVWGKVRVRGHASEVLKLARLLVKPAPA